MSESGSVDSRRGPNAERKRATRRLLIDTAAERFADVGYQATSLDDLSRRAGVTKGALYHHFRDKQALFAAVVDDVERQLRLNVARQLRGKTRAWDRLVGGCLAVVDASADRAVYRLLYVDGPAVLGTAAWREIDADHWQQDLRRVLADAIADQDLAPLPVDVLAPIIAGALTEAAQLVGSAGDFSAARRAQAREVVAALLSGLRATTFPAG